MNFLDDDFLDIPDCLPRSNSISGINALPARKKAYSYNLATTTLPFQSGSSISRKSSIRSSTTTSSATERPSTVATSGLTDVSVRGLFEEIKHLKKENLDLKLKIYFLEDSNSQSNKIKELMDYNVKLKMEVDDSNAEVERKKMLIEETIGILDVQQTKLDEYEKKIAFLGKIERLVLKNQY